jgi:hypothetical protein
MNKIKKSIKDDTQKDLNNHGLQDIIPPNEEYYTLDLKRGNDTDIVDLPDIDVVGKDPLNESDDLEIVEYLDKSTSSNAGGVTRQKHIINQNDKNGAVAGEPGHWGIDEDTG